MLSAAAVVSLIVLATGLPAGLTGSHVSLKSWGAIAGNRLIILLLLITALGSAGQFVIFTYLGPLLSTLASAGTEEIAALFAIFGVMGFLGNVLATRVVGVLGTFLTALLSFGSIFLGMLVWSLGAGVLTVMSIAVALWGLGFAAANSMQQARLVAAAPELSSASVALNTSAIYIGQAIGSALGGILFACELTIPIGYVGTAFLFLTLVLLALTRRGRGSR